MQLHIKLVSPPFNLKMGQYARQKFTGTKRMESAKKKLSIETGIKVETINNRPLFKFTDRLQLHLETLLEKNKVNDLTAEEQDELNAINELDRLFTYLNSLLLAQK